VEEKLEHIVAEIQQRIELLRKQGRTDLVLRAVSPLVLEELQVEAAKSKLSPLVITSTYRFLLPAYGKEVDLSPLHKTVYIFFLNHPEGIEFKQLVDYKSELYDIYKKIATRMDISKIKESVDRLVDPLDNAINEKCSRIKKAFIDITDEYTAQYYIISSHMEQPVSATGKIWYKRLKVIRLPRNFVHYEG
jgi:hypothetical protein